MESALVPVAVLDLKGLRATPPEGSHPRERENGPECLLCAGPMCASKTLTCCQGAGAPDGDGKRRRIVEDTELK